MKAKTSSSIEASVQQALAQTLDLADPRVSLVGDVAYVEGTAHSYQQKNMAAETVRLLTGASRVVNRLRVAPSRSTKDWALRDAVLQAVRSHLRSDPRGLLVQARQGVVELRGKVASLADRCAAESAAWSVAGVMDVRNHLEVEGLAPSPESLARQLRQAVSQCLCLDINSFEVMARGDTVYLRGKVPSPYHRHAAEDLVRSHSQVREVVNELSAEAPPTAQHLRSRASA